MQKEERCCGGCCWFYAEDTYGYGVCPFRFGDVKTCDEVACGDDFVSKEVMRHHQAVLLQFGRWMRKGDGDVVYMPDVDDVREAVSFSYKYIKVFSDL